MTFSQNIEAINFLLSWNDTKAAHRQMDHVIEKFGVELWEIIEAL